MVDRSAHVDDGWRAVRAAAPAGPDDAAANRGHLTFLGHSAVLIEIDDLRILTDPVLREGVGPVRRQVQAVLPELFADLDAVFISHGHHDHLDLAVPAPDPRQAHPHRPQGFGKIAEKAALGPVEEVEPGDRLTIDRVRFEVMYADHSRPARALRADRPGARLRHRRLADRVLPGDTDLFPAMGELAGRLDVAMLPVWGWGPQIGEGHLDPIRAAAAAAIIRPRLAIPIHWGTYYPAGMRRLAPDPLDHPGHDFAAALAQFAPDVPSASSRPASPWTCRSSGLRRNEPRRSGGVRAWERGGGFGQPNATWATTPIVASSVTRTRSSAGKAPTASASKYWLCADIVASPFGPVGWPPGRRPMTR